LIGFTLFPEMASQKIQPLNPSEQQWVAAELANARKLVELLNGADAQAELTPAVLDRTYKAAREAAGDDASSANQIINAIGMSFGQYLVDQLGFRWVVVSDKQGTELGVVALPGEADMIVLPPNLVGKRWAAGTVDFLEEVYRGVVENLERIKADLAARPGNNQALRRTGAAVKRSWFQRLFGRAAGR
jgi:hypothetical protein